MVAIDTNIIVRFLTHDDEIQYSKALNIFKKNEIFIPDTVILETEWVLRYAYDFNPADISAAFTKLFGLKNVHLSDPHANSLALEWHRKGLDFSDALHLALSQQNSKLYSFDTDFAKKAKGLGNCTVTKP